MSAMAVWEEAHEEAQQSPPSQQPSRQSFMTATTTDEAESQVKNVTVLANEDIGINIVGTRVTASAGETLNQARQLPPTAAAAQATTNHEPSMVQTGLNAPVSVVTSNSTSKQIDGITARTPEAPTSSDVKTPSVPTVEIQAVNVATIELLLLSGSRKRYTFDLGTKVTEVLAFVYKEWPESWSEDKPQALSQLRLLHRGQFLQDLSPLASCNIEPGQVTVMHLNIRPAEAATSGFKRTPLANNAFQEDSHESGCCVGCCIS